MAATKSKATPRRRKAAKGPKPGMGPIEPNVLYPMWIFIRTVGTTYDGFRAMRERGLEVTPDGKRTMILGQDYIDYCKRQKQHQNASASSADQETPPGVEGSV